MNPLNPMMSLAGNPLFAIGSQIMANSARGPTYRPMMQGVPQAMSMAGQQAYMLEQLEQDRVERERAQAEREQRQGVTKKLQELSASGNPLDPRSVANLMLSGDPGMQAIGAQYMMKPPSYLSVGAGETVIDPSSRQVIAQGTPSMTNLSKGAKAALAQGLQPGTPEFAQYAGKIDFSAQQKADSYYTHMGVTDQTGKTVGIVRLDARGGPPQLVDVPGLGLAARPQDSAQLQGAISTEKGRGKAVGTAMGEAEAELADRVASGDRLEEVVNELSALGKEATYTKAGQITDTLTRQLGLPMRDAAIARKEYIAKIDNEILPLLRQTFGAQFTQKEGESLKATLGDPDTSPEEKDAVLRSFIQTKRAQIETLRKRTGGTTGIQGPVPGGVKFLGFE